MLWRWLDRHLHFEILQTLMNSSFPMTSKKKEVIINLQVQNIQKKYRNARNDMTYNFHEKINSKTRHHNP